MEKWQENVLRLEESLRDIIDEINNGCLVYSEVESVDEEIIYKQWKDYDGNTICLIRDEYEANFYRYDEGNNQIYNGSFNSINNIYCHKGYTVISSYDRMNNIIYKKFIYSNGTFSEERWFYNENNKLIKNHFTHVSDNTSNYYFFDENGKPVGVSGFLNKNIVCTSGSNKNISKYLCLLNKNRTGYKKYSFFGYDMVVFMKTRKKIYPKYKIKDIQKKTEFISNIKKKD